MLARTVAALALALALVVPATADVSIDPVPEAALEAGRRTATQSSYWIDQPYDPLGARPCAPSALARFVTRFRSSIGDRVDGYCVTIESERRYRLTAIVIGRRCFVRFGTRSLETNPCAVIALPMVGVSRATDEQRQEMP